MCKWIAKLSYFSTSLMSLMWILKYDKWQKEKNQSNSFAINPDSVIIYGKHFIGEYCSNTAYNDVIAQW